MRGGDNVFVITQKYGLHKEKGEGKGEGKGERREAARGGEAKSRSTFPRDAHIAHCLEAVLKLLSIEESLAGEEEVVGLYGPPRIVEETDVQHGGVVLAEQLLQSAA